MSLIEASSTLVEPPSNRWLQLEYNDKIRIGLDMGDDARPGSNNRVVITLDGIRTFNKDLMENVEDVTTLLC